MNDFLIRLILVILGGSFLYYVWVRINRSVFNDFFSPFNMLFLFWILPLLLGCLDLSIYEQPWSFKSFFAMTAVTTILVSISIIPVLRRKRIRSFIDSRLIFQAMLQRLGSKNATILLLFIYIPLFLLYFYVEFITNPAGLAILSGFLGKLSLQVASYYGWGKTIGRTYFSSILTTVSYPLNILSPMFYLKFKLSRKRAEKFFFFFVAILMTLFAFVKLLKIDIILAILGLVMADYYFNKYTQVARLSKKLTRTLRGFMMVIASTIFVGAIFGSTLVFRIGVSDNSSQVINWIGYKFSTPSLFNSISALVYAYSALSFENVNRFITSYDGGLNVGISALRPFLSILGQGSIADAMLKNIDFNVVVPGVTAGTFLSPVYAELGWFGILFFSAMYAFLINKLYLRFRHNPNYLNFFLYLNFAFCWFFNFFSNAFATLTFYTNSVFIIMFAYLFMSKIVKPKIISGCNKQ